MDAPGPAGATPSLCAFAAGWDTAISTESEKDFADLRGQSARPAVPFHPGRPGRTSCLRPLVNDAARRGTIVNEALTTSVQVYGSDVNGVRARSLSIRASLVRELGFAGQRVHCPASVVSCVMLQVAFVAGPSPSSAHSPKPREPWTVLLVEDEPLILELMVEVFEEEGLRVLTAADADEALATVASREVDLLFTDIDLARSTNGAVLAHRARAMRPDLKVIYASGRREGLDPGQAVPGSAFLPKPYRPAQACDLVGRMLAGPRPL